MQTPSQQDWVEARAPRAENVALQLCVKTNMLALTPARMAWQFVTQNLGHDPSDLLTF